MGRQFRFYMDGKDLQALFDHVNQNGTVICDGGPDQLEKITDIKQTDGREGYFQIAFTNQPMEEIKIDHLVGVQGNFISYHKSAPIVELVETWVDEEEKIIRYGRIWMTMKYVEDGEWKEKNASLLTWYNSLVRWIKKNVHSEMMLEYEGKKKKISISEGFVKLIREEGFRTNETLEFLPAEEDA